MKKLIRYGLSSLMAIALFTHANAQDVAIQQAFTSSQINNDVLSNVAKHNNGTVSRLPEKNFTYNPAPVITQKALNQLISKMKIGEANASALQQYNYSQVFSGLAGSYHLQYNDAADILTAYQVQSWMIANSAPDPSPTAVAAVNRQVRQILSGNQQLTTNSYNRAMLGEQMKILFVIANAGWQSARKQGNVKSYSNGIEQLYQQQYHTDLRSLKLDDKGLHP